MTLPAPLLVTAPTTTSARRVPTSTIVALAVLAVAAGACALAPVLARHDPNAQDLANILKTPDGTHWLGTDDLGRDLFARLLFGGRVSLIAGLEGVAVAAVIGIPAGVAGGFLGGRTDAVVSRLLDALMSFPPILLALVVVTVLGPGLHNAMIAIGIVYSPRLGRVARAATKDVSTEAFVDAARMTGCGFGRLAVRHVLPNIAGPLIVQATLMMAAAILAEASLSFLGLGVQPPSTSWGLLLGRGFRHLDEAPLYVIAPGLAIAMVVLAINTVGDALHARTGGTRQSNV